MVNFVFSICFRHFKLIVPKRYRLLNFNAAHKAQLQWHPKLWTGIRHVQNDKRKSTFDILSKVFLVKKKNLLLMSGSDLDRDESKVGERTKSGLP